ncbi:PRC-barrel domain containing protein [Streptomyces sp. NPDC096193]|uniref:PRC-barrel domain containing protein n=1 Tax=Streptomyces sp. NPDC096193 TaxID=3155821 RepID=UPI00332F0A61
MSEFDIWVYRPSAGYQEGVDIVGYKVEAIDGSIGKVSKHSEEVGSSHIVVDTGVWIFGKHVLLPAGTIKLIDAAEETALRGGERVTLLGFGDFHLDGSAPVLRPGKALNGYVHGASA